MRIISADKIKNTVAELCVQANRVLRPDMLKSLNSALRKETNSRAKRILTAVIQNSAIARRSGLAICQDTGLPCVFVEIGNNVKISGDLKKAINQGVEAGYQKGFLRSSVIKNPLARARPGRQPAIIHIDLVPGNKLKLTVMPKGFGCENKARLKMFNPTAKIGEIKDFIIDTVKNAGPDACPPFVVGVGIGGTADYACLLAKKALLRKIKNQKSKIKITKQNSKIKKLEKELLNEVNRLDIGPMGLGGKTTALAVNVATYPTHIAGLPVCVNISCHALRSGVKEI